MLQIVGTCASIETEKVTPATGDPFESTTIRVVSAEGRLSFVRVARDFVGVLPAEREPVRLAVFVRPYVKADGSAGYGLTAFMRLDAPAAAVAV
jgi:hypothetical protein